MSAAPFELLKDETERLLAGRWQGTPSRVTVRGISIDSRRVTPQSIFACIQGDRVDGHDFASIAVGDGAAMVLAERELDLPVPVVVVENVPVAMAILAAEYRRHHANATWIAVSGANGKTTVKELLVAACASRGPVHATSGNLNNHLGVPLTVLNTPADARVVVVELGANREGEISYLAAIVQPHLGVLTSIGPAHLEGYGDLAGLTRGESAVFGHVSDDGTVFFGATGLADAAAEATALYDIIRTAAGSHRLVEVGGSGLPVRGEIDDEGIVIETDHGRQRLRLMGRHNLANAHLAYQVALAVGVEPAQALAGLGRARPVPGRMRRLEVVDHIIFDDCYNANPASMGAGLNELARRPGARLAVLGVMKELGTTSDDLHVGVGRIAARLGIPLVVVGACARPIADGYRATGATDVVVVADAAAAVDLVQRRCAIGPTSVLVKGSRAAGLERVVVGLQRALAEGGPC